VVEKNKAAWAGCPTPIRKKLVKKAVKGYVKWLRQQQANEVKKIRKMDAQTW